MKAKFPPFSSALSLLVYVSLCSVQATASEEDTRICGCITYDEDTTIEATPPDLSAKEKVEFERGVMLNKEIALYGVDTLRHYKAKVVSIRPATGGDGAEIELRTLTALVHKRGAPWCTFEQQPTSTRTLHWHWANSRPAPVCVGVLVSAYVDSDDRIQRVSSFDEFYLTAIRKMMPRGFWELCVQTGGVDRKFLVLQPDYVNLAGGGVIQIEWTIKRGLAVSHFSPKDPPTGGDGEYEEEKHSQNWPGMPVINLPGFHVRPGRDGWKTIGALLQTPQSMYKPNALHAYWSLKAFRETNPDQFVATSYNWDVMHR